MKKHAIATALSLIALAAIALAAPVAGFAATPAAPATAPHTIASVDLAKPFGTHAPWRFIATQGPAVPDPQSVSGDAPGAVTPCLTPDAGKTCLPDAKAALRREPGKDDFLSEPHYVFGADVVRTQDDRPLLLLSLGSLHTGDGDQLVGTQVYAYDRAHDGFVLAYSRVTGNNNNQDLRFMSDGPLRGDIVTAEPTSDAPFAYWVTVNRMAAGGDFREVLRYRSATRYNDGNPLAVIDAEMPNIEQRLGVWKPGMPLPLPKRGCEKPHRVKTVLWCR